MNLAIPDPSLVLLIGASGSGKSTFARTHFQPTEVVSSDACRAMICDDESDQSVTPEAFSLLRQIVSLRLRHRRLTVIDATNVQRRARMPLLALAREHNVPAAAIVFNLEEAACLQNNQMRPHRSVPPAVILQQLYDLHNSLAHLSEEGFACIYILRHRTEIEEAAVFRNGRTLQNHVPAHPPLLIAFGRKLRRFLNRSQ